MTVSQKLQNQIEEFFKNTVQKDPNIHNAFLLVNNDPLDLHVNVCTGVNRDIDKPYYIASIGKVFTSVLIGQMVEKSLIGYDEPVMEILGKDLVDGLHTYKGVNYAGQITVRQLLNHTSGIGDYFSDKPKSGKPMLDIIQENPYQTHSPLEIIAWSKQHLTPKFRPDTGFHYSDTGYHLLGLIIEKVLQMPLHMAIKKCIVDPLGLKNTWMASHDNTSDYQNRDICDVYWGNENVRDYSIFKDDFAGGGIVTTSSELHAFFRAVVEGRLVSESTLKAMTKWSKYSSIKLIGIAYGLGLMNIKSTPLLFPKKFESYGHIGSIGSLMFYNPTSKTYIISNVNRFMYHRKSMNIFARVLKMVMIEFESR